jgi:CubicO group peptidase (beta-lactamase class C family)
MPSYKNSDMLLPIMQGSPPALVPPKMDWDRPPWNRWAFQHVREILPTAEVWRGSGPVRELPRADVHLDALPVTNTAGAADTLAGLLDETYTDGFLVLKDGAVALERYFNGMTPRSLHLSQSVAKSFTGMVAGILIGRGVLDVNALVTTYLPELEQTGWRGATLQQVLDMTTGTRFDENYTNPYSDIGQLDVASGWKPIPPDSDPAFKWPRDMWELITGLSEVDRPHGDLFSYRSIETDVLAFSMERTTGKRLPQLLSEELWQRMGAEESACLAVDSAGYALADGGLNATLRDYGRFGQLILENGGGVIPASWVEATRNGNHAIFKEPYTLSFPQGAYKNQFWIEDPASRAIMCRGVFGQLIYINWDYNMVVVKLSSWPDFLSIPFNISTLGALHAIGKKLVTL